MNFTVASRRVAPHALCAWICAVLCVPWCTAARADVPDHELKAAVIARLTEFVEWPDVLSGADEDAPSFAICVFGDSPVREPLERLPRLMAVNGRPLAVRPIERARDSTTCDIVFVPAAANAALGAIQAEVHGRPVLLINEIPGAPKHGQIITLYTEHNRLRIAVHLREANDAGLKISARLLKLAEVVD